MVIIDTALRVLCTPFTAAIQQLSLIHICLTNFAINALDAGSGYIYGAYGQDVTMAFLKQQQSRFFTDSDANLTNSEVNFIYETYGGKPAFDCIGLIKAYEWIDEDTGIIRYQSNGFRDVGADGMFRSAVIFGEIYSIPCLLYTSRCV